MSVTPTQKGIMLALCAVQLAFVYGSVFLKERLNRKGTLYHPVIFALFRELAAGAVHPSSAPLWPQRSGLAFFTHWYPVRGFLRVPDLAAPCNVRDLRCCR